MCEKVPYVKIFEFFLQKRFLKLHRVLLRHLKPSSSVSNYKKLSLPALFAASGEYLELGGLAVVVEHLPLRQPHLVLMMNINNQYQYHQHHRHEQCSLNITININTITINIIITLTAIVITI